MAILELFHFEFSSITTRFFYAILLSILLIMALFTSYSLISHSLGAATPLKAIPVKAICLFTLLPSLHLLMRRLALTSQSSFSAFAWPIFLPRLVALCLPLVSLVCVLRLNSFSDSALTAIFLILLIFFFLVLTVNPSITPDTNLQAWFIFGISSALVFGSTFRGDGGFWGFDINLEFASASKVLNEGFWLPPQQSSAYDSMLSITVLPLVLALFSNLSMTIIFKLFYALVLSLIPTALYVWCAQFVSRFSAMVISGSLVIGSISFIPQMTALNRQVVGTAFFVAILMVLGEKNWSVFRKQVVGLLMAAGMACSHYSTSYLASIIFAMVLVINAALFFISPERFRKTKRVFTPTFSIAIILFTVLWNGVVTNSLQDVKPIIDRTLTQGLSFLPNEDQSLWTRWVGGTVINREPSDKGVALEKTVRQANLLLNVEIGIRADKDSLDYRLQPVDIPNPSPLFGARVATTFSNLMVFARTFFQLFSFVGLIVLFRRFFILRNWSGTPRMLPSISQSVDLFGVGLAALIIGVLARTSGTLAPLYNPERVALQLVMALLIPSAIALEYILFRKKLFQIFVAVPVLVFQAILLLQATSISGYVLGSDTTRIASLQENYSPFIISESERTASSWLSRNISSSAYLQTDSRGFLSVLQNGRRATIESLDPVNLLKGSYIYAANSNVIGQMSRAQTPFVFPEDYIDQKYRVIYSSNRARIYH